MAVFIRTIERLTGSFGVIAGWIIVPLIAATVYEVFSRYALNAPTIWAYEVAYMATGTNFLLGAAFALRERAHIRIDVLFVHLPPKVRAVIDVAGYLLLFLPTAYWLSYLLWEYAFDAYVSGEVSGQSAWNPIIWPFRTVFFAGFALLALQGTVETIKAFYVIAGRVPPGAPAAEYDYAQEGEG
jgi:TRAP-type mannitol/chloroaromatic compound transport system permease small subunit